jgi:hypothetical protein
MRVCPTCEKIVVNEASCGRPDCPFVGVESSRTLETRSSGSRGDQGHSVQGSLDSISHTSGVVIRWLAIASIAIMALAFVWWRYQGSGKLAEPTAAVGCGANCIETGRVPFVHPEWGSSTLVTSMFGQERDQSGDLGPATKERVDVVDSDGNVRWSREFTDLGYSFAPLERPIDSTGHIFIAYNPGRYDGVIVLAPTKVGFLDFGSLPPPGSYEGSFYSATVRDIDGDGAYEITMEMNDCEPSCAEGALRSVVLRWNGADYSEM